MSTFYNSKNNTTIRKLTNLTALQAVAYTTQVNDDLNLKKIDYLKWVAVPMVLRN